VKGHRFLALSVFLFTCLALAFLVATLAAQETLPPPAGEPISLNIEWLGQLGGEGTTVVAVQSHFAFTNLGSRLVTLNIADPTHPLVVGQSEPFLTGSLSSLVIVNNLAYATAGDQLWVIEPTDPTQPAPVRSHPIPGAAQQVTVVGHYAYVAGSTGLQIFDISYPLLPAEVGFYETPQAIMNVTVIDNYAYLGLGWCGLDDCSTGAFHIVDISDPADPTAVSASNLPASPTTVVVNNHKAYVMVEDRLCDEIICYYYGELRVLDITNPSLPTQMGVFAPIWSPGKLTIMGNNAYIPSFGLLVLDISDPTNITTVGTHEVPGIAREVAIVDGIALLAADWTGLWLLDVSDPAAITEVGHYDAPTNPQTIEVVNDYAYLTGSDGLHILDVANPYNPYQLGALSYFGSDHYFNDTPLAVSGDYAYLAGKVLTVTNISDPTTPFLVTIHDDPTIDAYNDVMVIDGFAYLIGQQYIAGSPTWLEIVDISTPSTPTTRTLYPLPYWPTSLDIAGNYAYASSLNGLQIINISNPSSPSLEGVFSLEDYANGRKVVVAGQYAFLLGNLNPDSKLWIIDVSDPGNPVLTSSYAFPNDGWYISPSDLELVGHHLYVSNATRLNILDVSEITAPVEVGDLFAAYNFGFHEIAVIGNTIYSASGADGLLNLRFTADSHTVTANSGATLVYTDTQGTNATIAIAPGSVNITTTLVYSELPPGLIQPGMALAGHAFDLVAYQDGTPLPELTFLQPLTVTIHYADATIGVIADETALELQWRQENTWLPAVTTCDPPSTVYHDLANNLIQMPICRTGRFAIFGPTNQTFLPLLP
jgi:hypothetical protein